MSRRPALKSRQRPNGTYYYCVHRGKQHGLGYDYTEAKKAFARLIGGIPQTCDQTVTVGELVSMFDEWSQTFSAKRTADDYVYWLVRWSSEIADVPAGDIRPKHVDDYIRQCGLAGTWSHHKLVRSVRRLYRWASDQGHATYNPSPIAGLRSPRKPDSPERVFSNMQVWFLWRSSPKDFRRVLRWYYGTGCRPEEIRIRCEWVNTNARIVTIPAPKAKGKRKQRVIQYPMKLSRMVRRCLARSTTGYLFETRVGKKFTKLAIELRHKKLRLRQPALFPDGCHARMWRYTFATRALKKGIPMMDVAHLLGHKDVTILAKHYEKIGLDRDHLQRAIDRI